MAIPHKTKRPCAFLSQLMLEHSKDRATSILCFDVDFEETTPRHGFAANPSEIKVTAKFLLTDPLPDTIKDILDRKNIEQSYRLSLMNDSGHAVWARDLMLVVEQYRLVGNIRRPPPRGRRAEGEPIIKLYKEGSPKWQWFMQQSGETRDILASISQRLSDDPHRPELHVTFRGIVQTSTSTKVEPATLTPADPNKVEVNCLAGATVNINGKTYRVVRFGDVATLGEIYAVVYGSNLYTARRLFANPGYEDIRTFSLCKLVKTSDTRVAGEHGGGFSSLELKPEDEVLIVDWFDLDS